MPPRPPSSSAAGSSSPGVSPAGRRVTLGDIAKAVGVTPMTVSRALRNQPRVSEAMRLTIVAKANEMGYHPDPALSALVHYRRGRTGTAVKSALAWLNTWPNPKQMRRFREFDLYWHGALRSAEKMGFHLEEFWTGGDLSPERLTQILDTRNVQGILLPPGQVGDEWLARFPWSRFSIVSLSRSDLRLPVHMVTPDQVQNAMLAFAKIRERGYRRVGFVGLKWLPRTFGAGVRWCQLWDAPEDRVPVCLFPPERQQNRQILRAWYDEHRPDAILTDVPELPEMLAELGVRVPEDIGLAAMTVLDCPIDAGIYQNPEEIGRVGVLVLGSLINDNDRGIPAISRQILISGRWVDGRSLPDRSGGHRPT